MSASLIGILFSVALAASTEQPEMYSSGEPLPRAHASPLNVDADVDCAIKELAWEYAKKLLPRVCSVVVAIYAAFVSNVVRRRYNINAHIRYSIVSREGDTQEMSSHSVMTDLDPPVQIFGSIGTEISGPPQAFLDPPSLKYRMGSIFSGVKFVPTKCYHVCRLPGKLLSSATGIKINHPVQQKR